jgi:hypothetical protein
MQSIPPSEVAPLDPPFPLSPSLMAVAPEVSLASGC